MQERNAPERGGTRPGRFLQPRSDDVPHQPAEADGIRRKAEGRRQAAGPHRPHGREGAGRRGRGLHGPPPQRIHHAHGLPAQCLRSRPGGGYRLGGEALCRLRRRRGRHSALVLPAHRRTRHARSRDGQPPQADGRQSGKSHRGRHRSLPDPAGTLPQEHGDGQI